VFEHPSFSIVCLHWPYVSFFFYKIRDDNGWIGLDIDSTYS